MLKEISRAATRRPSHIKTHTSISFKFQALGKHDAILDSFATTTPTMHARAVHSVNKVNNQLEIWTDMSSPTRPGDCQNVLYPWDFFFCIY